MKPRTMSRGFGDTVEKFTKATGIKRVVDKVAAATNRVQKEMCILFLTTSKLRQ